MGSAPAVITSMKREKGPITAPMPSTPREQFRFGQFELDIDAGELRRNGSRLRLQPQPFKLLVLLTRRAGALVSRDEIRGELWQEGTFVDFDQAVNFAVKQIRDALGDSAERPLYLETVPRRGYRFIAPIESGPPGASPHNPAPPGSSMTVRLQKAVWANIAEIRMAEARRKRLTSIAIGVGVVVLVALTAYVVAVVR
jgi:DNA-binding winged helix-turn-helix (wHTH) protein